MRYIDEKYFDDYSEDHCAYSSNITIENCDCIDNIGSIITIDSNTKVTCKAKVYLNEIVYFAKNKALFIFYLIDLAVYMNGTITMFENSIQHNIMELEFCEISFTKSVAFLSNICMSIFGLLSKDVSLIVMEHANITFFNTTYDHLIFLYDVSAGSNYLGIFPNCIFQYMTLTRVEYNVSELTKLYTINFSDNSNKKVSNSSYGYQINTIYDFLTHCRWLSSAVFQGYSPGYVNQQIIQVDGH